MKKVVFTTEVDLHIIAEALSILEPDELVITNIDTPLIKLTPAEDFRRIEPPSTYPDAQPKVPELEQSEGYHGLARGVDTEPPAATPPMTYQEEIDYWLRPMTRADWEEMTPEMRVETKRMRKIMQMRRWQAGRRGYDPATIHPKHDLVYIGTGSHKIVDIEGTLKKWGRTREQVVDMIWPKKSGEMALKAAISHEGKKGGSETPKHDLKTAKGMRDYKRAHSQKLRGSRTDFTTDQSKIAYKYDRNIHHKTVDIEQSLKNLGRTRDEILGQSWPMKSVEFRLKASIQRRRT